MFFDNSLNDINRQPLPHNPGDNEHRLEHPGTPPHSEKPERPVHPEHPGKPDYPEKPGQPITILVNGQDRTLPIGTKRISYDEVVALAYPNQGDNGQNILYTVSYSNGPDKNPKGNLAKGNAVFVKNGMVFNVSRSDKS